MVETHEAMTVSRSRHVDDVNALFNDLCNDPLPDDSSRDTLPHLARASNLTYNFGVVHCQGRCRHTDDTLPLTKYRRDDPDSVIPRALGRYPFHNFNRGSPPLDQRVAVKNAQSFLSPRH